MERSTETGRAVTGVMLRLLVRRFAYSPAPNVDRSPGLLETSGRIYGRSTEEFEVPLRGTLAVPSSTGKEHILLAQPSILERVEAAIARSRKEWIAP